MNFLLIISYFVGSCKGRLLDQLYSSIAGYSEFLNSISDSIFLEYATKADTLVVSDTLTFKNQSRLFILFREHDLYIVNCSSKGELVGEIIYETLSNPNGYTNINYMFDKTVEVIKTNNLSDIKEIYVIFDSSKEKTPEFTQEMLKNHTLTYIIMLKGKLGYKAEIKVIPYEILTSIIFKKNNIREFNLDDLKVYIEKEDKFLKQDEIVEKLQELKEKALKKSLRENYPSMKFEKDSDKIMFAILKMLRDKLDEKDTPYKYFEFLAVIEYLVNKEKFQEIYKVIWDKTFYNVQYDLIKSYKSLMHLETPLDHICGKIAYEDILILLKTVKKMEEFRLDRIERGSFLALFIKFIVQSAERFEKIVKSRNKENFDIMEILDKFFNSDCFENISKSVKNSITETFSTEHYCFSTQEGSFSKSNNILKRRIINSDVIPKDLLSDKYKNILKPLLY